MNPFLKKGLDLAAAYANRMLKDPKVQEKIIENVSKNVIVKELSKKVATKASEYTPPKHAKGKFQDPMYYAGYKLGKDAKKFTNKSTIQTSH